MLKLITATNFQLQNESAIDKLIKTYMQIKT